MATKKRTDSTAIKDSKHDSMFKIVKLKNDKYGIAVGANLISRKEFDNFSSADNYIGTKPWELIVNLNYLICKEYEKEKQNAVETKENTTNN